MKLNEEEIRTIIDSLDIHHNHIINYSEFIAAIIDKKKFLTKEKLWATFKFFDKDNCGQINKENLKKALMYINTSCQIINKKLDEHLVEEEVEEILSELSPTRGSIDFL